MQNLDQIRAAAALKLLPPGKKHDFTRSDIASIPALILANGLLPAAAFCCENGKDARKGMKYAFDGIATYLQQRGIVGAGTTTGEALIEELTSRNTETLQRATTEALAYLALLKRFTLPKE